LREILAMPSGAIYTTALESDVEVSVTRNFQSLLLDVLREVDEAQRDAAGGSVHDPFGFGEDWFSLESTPPPASAGPPRSGPALTEACRLAAVGVPHAKACAVVDLDAGVLIGVHRVGGLDGDEDDALAEAIGKLVRSPNLGLLDALVASEPAPGAGGPRVRDLRISSSAEFRFVRVTRAGRYAVVLVAARDMNPGLGWAQFRALLPSVERHLP
jgi:hypothetical protein